MSHAPMNQPPRATKTVKLSAPVEWHLKVLTELTIEEPSAKTFLSLGSPQIWVHNNAGGGALVDNADVLANYIDRCVKIDGASQFVELLSLEDGLKIKEAILGFFGDARSRILKE